MFTVYHSVALRATPTVSTFYVMAVPANSALRDADALTKKYLVGMFNTSSKA